MSTWLEPLLANTLIVTVLALFVLAISRLRVRPTVLHSLWLIVLLKFVTPPVIQIDLAMPFRDATTRDEIPTMERLPEGSTIDTANALQKLESPRVPNLSQQQLEDLSAKTAADLTTLTTPQSRKSELGANSWLMSDGFATTLTWLWLSGSAVWFLLATTRLVQFFRQVRRTPKADDDMQSLAREMARKMGLRSIPELRVTTAKLPPMLVHSVQRAIIVLPSELLVGLAPSEQSSVIAHELAHYRRGDHWVRWIEFVVLGIYWWHPIAWLARRQLRNAEEACCDAWVVSIFPHEAKSYARTLMATIDFLSDSPKPVPLSVSGFGESHSLKGRLQMILKRTCSPKLAVFPRLMLLALALVILPCVPAVYSQNQPSKPRAWLTFPFQERARAEAQREAEIAEQHFQAAQAKLKEVEASSQPQALDELAHDRLLKLWEPQSRLCAKCHQNADLHALKHPEVSENWFKTHAGFLSQLQQRESIGTTANLTAEQRIARLEMALEELLAALEKRRLLSNAVEDHLAKPASEIPLGTVISDPRLLKDPKPSTSPATSNAAERPIGKSLDDWKVDAPRPVWPKAGGWKSPNLPPAPGDPSRGYWYFQGSPLNDRNTPATEAQKDALLRRMAEEIGKNAAEAERAAMEAERKLRSSGYKSQGSSNDARLNELDKTLEAFDQQLKNIEAERAALLKARQDAQPASNDAQRTGKEGASAGQLPEPLSKIKTNLGAFDSLFSIERIQFYPKGEFQTPDPTPRVVEEDTVLWTLVAKRDVSVDELQLLLQRPKGQQLPRVWFGMTVSELREVVKREEPAKLSDLTKVVPLNTYWNGKALAKGDLLKASVHLGAQGSVAMTKSGATLAVFHGAEPLDVGPQR